MCEPGRPRPRYALNHNRIERGNSPNLRYHRARDPAIIRQSASYLRRAHWVGGEDAPARRPRLCRVPTYPLLAVPSRNWSYESSPILQAATSFPGYCDCHCGRRPTVWLPRRRADSFLHGCERSGATRSGESVAAGRTGRSDRPHAFRHSAGRWAGLVFQSRRPDGGRRQARR